MTPLNGKKVKIVDLIDETANIPTSQVFLSEWVREENSRDLAVKLWIKIINLFSRRAYSLQS